MKPNNTAEQTTSETAERLAQKTLQISYLTTGVKLIGMTQYVSYNGNPVVIIHQPYEIHEVITAETEVPAVVMIPWMAYAKNHAVPLAMDVIAASCQADDEITARYAAMTNKSNLIVPANNITIATAH